MWKDGENSREIAIPIRMRVPSHRDGDAILQRWECHAYKDEGAMPIRMSVVGAS